MRQRLLNKFLLVAAVAYFVTVIGAHRWAFAQASGPTFCKAVGMLASPALDSDTDGDQAPDNSSVPMPDPAVLPRLTLFVPTQTVRTIDPVLMPPSSHIQEIPLEPPETVRA